MIQTLGEFLRENKGKKKKLTENVIGHLVWKNSDKDLNTNLVKIQIIFKKGLELEVSGGDDGKLFCRISYMDVIQANLFNDLIAEFVYGYGVETAFSTI